VGGRRSNTRFTDVVALGVEAFATCHSFPRRLPSKGEWDTQTWAGNRNTGRCFSPVVGHYCVPFHNRCRKNRHNQRAKRSFFLQNSGQAFELKNHYPSTSCLRQQKHHQSKYIGKMLVNISSSLRDENTRRKSQ